MTRSIKTLIGLGIAGVAVVAIFAASLFNANKSFPSRAGRETSLRPAGAEDHMRGNPDAPITIIEFADLECPYCKRFHPTLQKVLQQYPLKVRWIYRHFPLAIHSESMPAALASECAAELGGNDTFWNFIDSVFANQERIGDALFTEVAANLKLPAEQFKSCLASKKYAGKIEQDAQEAEATGAGGTPWSIVLTPDGRRTPIDGALPFEQVQNIIEQAESR
jgi:protein-disulfide isomerase